MRATDAYSLTVLLHLAKELFEAKDKELNDCQTRYNQAPHIHCCDYSLKNSGHLCDNGHKLPRQRNSVRLAIPCVRTFALLLLGSW